MRKFNLWLLMLLLSSSLVFVSCYKEDNPVAPEVPEQLVLQYADAEEWVENHRDSLVACQLAICGNTCDPDQIRMMLSKIGYTGMYHSPYAKAERRLTKVILDSLVERAKKAGNMEAMITMGMSAGGKSTCLRNNPTVKQKVEESGVVYDATFSEAEKFYSLATMFQERGFTVSVVYIYNDAQTCFTNGIERFIKTNRPITIPYFEYNYPLFAGRIEYIEENFTDMTVYCFDNSHNSGGKLVTKEEAKTWDYTMNESVSAALHAILQQYIDAGKLTDEQIKVMLEGN